MVSAISPGFVETNFTKGYEAFGTMITPKVGTTSIRACLFNDLTASGHFYGSDGKRSPLTRRRDPEKEAEYTGE
jgi:hypothetical protein